MKENLSKLKDLTKAVLNLTNEMFSAVTKAVKEAGGIIFTDDCAVEEFGTDTLWGYYYNEFLDKTIETRILAVTVEDDTLIIYVSEHINDNWIDKKDRTLETLKEYDSYAVKCGLVLMSATLDNMCEILPQFIEHMKKD